MLLEYFEWIRYCYLYCLLHWVSICLLLIIQLVRFLACNYLAPFSSPWPISKFAIVRQPENNGPYMFVINGQVCVSSVDPEVSVMTYLYLKYLQVNIFLSSWRCIWTLSIYHNSGEAIYHARNVFLPLLTQVYIYWWFHNQVSDW